MNETKDKRAGYVSAEQKNKLFTLMQDRPALCSGRFSTSFTKKDGQKEWMNIETTLNGIPGGKKSWQQWRRTWQDMRSKVKSKQASIKRHAYGTGGGPPLLTKLKQNEEDILNLISNVAVNGHSSVQESVAHFDFKNADEFHTVPTVPALPIMVDTPQLVNNDVENEGGVCVDEIVLEVPSGPDIINIQETESTPNETIVAHGSLPTLTSVKKHTVSSAKKLQVAASAAELLSETAKEKLQMKREYYKRKVEIMEAAENRKREYHNRMLAIKEKKLIIEERKACALEKMCEKSSNELN